MQMVSALKIGFFSTCPFTEMKLIKYGGKRSVPMGSPGGGPDRYDTMKGESEKVLSRQDDGRKFL